MSYWNRPERFPKRYRFNEETKKWEFILAKHKKHPFCAVSHCRHFSDKGKGVGRSLKCTRCRVLLWRANNSIRATYVSIRNEAKRRSIFFSLTFQRFEELCLKTDYHKQRGRLPDDFHIDRIDVNRGYEDDNVQILTATENCKKRHTEYPTGVDNDDPF